MNFKFLFKSIFAEILQNLTFHTLALVFIKKNKKIIFLKFLFNAGINSFSLQKDKNVVS